MLSDHCVDLISDALPFGRLWVRRAKCNRECNRVREVSRARSHDAVIRVYDDAGNLIETQEHAGDFKDW